MKSYLKTQSMKENRAKNNLGIFYSKNSTFFTKKHNFNTTTKKRGSEKVYKGHFQESQSNARVAVQDERQPLGSPWAALGQPMGSLWAALGQPFSP